MGKVVIAAAGSGLARVVIDKLSADGKHDIVALVRKAPESFPSTRNVTWVQTTYQDKAELEGLFKGAIVVLSFIAVHNDPGSETQKRLVDAAVAAGVPRFAPSEWSMGENLETAVVNFPWYAEKLAMREYLRVINAEKKVIEYTLFQPGLWLDYLSWPHKTTKHFDPVPWFVSFENRRVIAMEGHMSDVMTITAVDNIAAVVAGAIDYEGQWPVHGGISGQAVTFADLKHIGERVRGGVFTVDLLKKEDLEAGVVNVEDLPVMQIPAIPKEQWEAFTKIATAGSLLSISKGGWSVPGTWNKLLPDIKFKQVEEFVEDIWGNK